MKKNVCAFSICSEVEAALTARARALGVSRSSVVERAVMSALGISAIDITAVLEVLSGKAGALKFKVVSDKMLVARRKLDCPFSPTLKIAVKLGGAYRPLKIKFSVLSVNERLIALLGGFFCDFAEKESRTAASLSYSEGVFEAEIYSAKGVEQDAEIAASFITRFVCALDARLARSSV